MANLEITSRQKTWLSEREVGNKRQEKKQKEKTKLKDAMNINQEPQPISHLSPPSPNTSVRCMTLHC